MAFFPFPNFYQDLVLRVKLSNQKMRESIHSRNHGGLSEYKREMNQVIITEIANELKEYYIAYYLEIHQLHHQVDWNRGEEGYDAMRVIEANAPILRTYFSFQNDMDLKVITRFTLLHNINSLILPMEAFFLNYTVGSPLSAYRVVWEQQNPPRKLISLNTRYGVFWFYVINQCMSERANVRLIEKIYDYDQSFADNQKRRQTDVRREMVPTTRVSIHFDVPDDKISPNIFLSVSRIEPSICTYCKKRAPNMKICKGCMDHLGISVRYCSKRCQRADFREEYSQLSDGFPGRGGHKQVCGASWHPEAIAARALRRKELDGLGFEEPE